MEECSGMVDMNMNREFSRMEDMNMNGGVFQGGGYEYEWRSVTGCWI